MVGVSASVNLPLHHKVQKFSSDTGSPGWSRKKGRKMVVVWWWCVYSIDRKSFWIVSGYPKRLSIDVFDTVCILDAFPIDYSIYISLNLSTVQ